MHRPLTHVLFVSQDNAARSLLAEACLRHFGGNKFKVFSCGVPPGAKGLPKEWALFALNTVGMSVQGLKCKDWTEFSRNGAMRMDFVIALDEKTVNEHPSWHGQPETALWAYPPLIQRKCNSTEVGLATLHTLYSLRRRIELLVSLHSKAGSRSDFRDDLRDLAHM